MSTVTIFWCLLGVLAVFDLTNAGQSASTWDYTCTSDEVCQKRGHSWCSFAAAEQRNGVDVGWCQKGPRPGGSSIISRPPPISTTPLPPKYYPYPGNKHPKTQDPDAGRWHNDIAGGRCWWTGCQSNVHRHKCPAATNQVLENSAVCRQGEVTVVCCR